MDVVGIMTYQAVQINWIPCVTFRGNRRFPRICKLGNLHLIISYKVVLNFIETLHSIQDTTGFEHITMQTLHTLVIITVSSSFKHEMEVLTSVTFILKVSQHLKMIKKVNYYLNFQMVINFFVLKNKTL